MPEREHNRTRSAGDPGVRLPRWRARLLGGQEVVTDARTRSEARARFKALLGQPIPAGTVITREDVQ